MLYSEFLKGTRAPETPDTYDQFQIIGQIYEDCEGMTKEEALSTLLPPGEIVNFAVAVQNASGFGNKAKKKVKDSVKNS